MRISSISAKRGLTAPAVYLLIALAVLTSCTPKNEPVMPSGSGSSMQILPPFAEPYLKWDCTYKGLLNTMVQGGFIVSRVAEKTIYYDYFMGSTLLETAATYLDADQNYIGAEVSVCALTVSQSDIKKFLSQQYIQTGSTQFPTPEIFYRSKVATDSILVSYRMEDGHPTITYTKGMN